MRRAGFSVPFQANADVPPAFGEDGKGIEHDGMLGGFPAPLLDPSAAPARFDRGDGVASGVGIEANLKLGFDAEVFDGGVEDALLRRR